MEKKPVENPIRDFGEHLAVYQLLILQWNDPPHSLIQGEEWRTQYPPVEEPSSYQDCLKFAIAGAMVAERKALEGEIVALAEAHGVEIEKDKSAFSSDED